MAFKVEVCRRLHRRDADEVLRRREVRLGNVLVLVPVANIIKLFTDVSYDFS